MFCPSCGSQSEIANYCPVCGTYLDGVRKALSGWPIYHLNLLSAARQLLIIGSVLLLFATAIILFGIIFPTFHDSSGRGQALMWIAVIVGSLCLASLARSCFTALHLLVALRSINVTSRRTTDERQG